MKVGEEDLIRGERVEHGENLTTDYADYTDLEGRVDFNAEERCAEEACFEGDPRRAKPERTSEAKCPQGGARSREDAALPDGWRRVRLGDVSNIYRGGSPRPIQAWLTTSVDGVNWIKIGDVAPEAKYITETEERITHEGASFSRSVNVGDFILSNSMSFGRPYILKISGCIHDGWLTIQNYQSSFDTEFLFYILASESVIKQYEAMAAGSSVKNLNKDKVAGVVIPLPPLPEQRAIAGVLGRVDRLVDNLAKRIAKKKAIKQGVMADLLTGRRRVRSAECGVQSEELSLASRVSCLSSNEDLRDSVAPCENCGAGVGGVSHGGTETRREEGEDFNAEEPRSRETAALPAGWRRVRLGEIAVVKKGEQYDQSKLQDGAPYPMVNGGIEPSGFSYEYNTEAGAITISEGGNSCGFVNRYDKRFWCGGHCYLIDPLPDVGKDFLYNVLKFNEPAIMALRVGSGLPNVQRDRLKGFELRIPSDLSEQRAIAGVLGAMDAEIAKLEAKKAKIERLKQGLMSDLLSGRVRVVGDGK